MTPQRLYINIDHVATVRQARRTDEPDPVEAARLAEAAGADGITVHLREDRRHIQDADVEALAPRGARCSTSSWPPARTCSRSPAACARTRSPSSPSGARRSPPKAASTSAGPIPRLRETIRRLDEAGVRVSLFIDPDHRRARRRQGSRRARRRAAHRPLRPHLARGRRRARRAPARGAPRRRHGARRARRPRAHLPQRRSRSPPSPRSRSSTSGTAS